MGERINDLEKKMTFDAQLIFTGLMVFCMQGECPWPTADMVQGTNLDANTFGASVLLVNATQTAPACHRVCDGSRLNCAQWEDVKCAEPNPNCNRMKCTETGVVTCENGETPCLNGQPYCEELGERKCFSCDHKNIPLHEPKLVLPNGDENSLVGKCYTLEVDGGDGSELEVEGGRSPGKMKPGLFQSKKALGWAVSLEETHRGIDGLREEARFAFSDGEQDLVTARININTGEIRSGRLSKKKASSKYKIWPFCPDATRLRKQPTDTPKVVADEIVLELEDVTEVRLVPCNGGATITIGPPEKGKTQKIRIENQPEREEVVEGMTISDPEHFLWYYELVSWNPGEFCEQPRYPRDIPVANDGTYSCSNIGGSGQLCPPTTYP